MGFLGVGKVPEAVSVFLKIRIHNPGRIIFCSGFFLFSNYKSFFPAVHIPIFILIIMNNCCYPNRSPDQSARDKKTEMEIPSRLFSLNVGQTSISLSF
jgi:hypothetical protein